MFTDINKMKEIIILTWCYDFGRINFGQVMQCYSLYYLCSQYGMNAKVIRYRKINVDENPERIPTNEKSRNLYEIQYRKRNEDFTLQQKKFLSFIENRIERTTLCYSEKEVKRICNEADIVIVGSDQIWNPDGYDSVFCPCSRKQNQIVFSYATSGISNVNKNNEHIIKEIAKRISGFDFISVREKISSKILSLYTDRIIDIVPDPVFLLSSKEWDSISTLKMIGEPYVLCFCYGDIQVQKHIVKEVMHRHGLTNICFIKMDGYYKEIYLEKNMCIYHDAGPAEILSLIKYATVVCTDSFHGFVFSLIYKKCFYLLERPNVHQNFAIPDRFNDVCKKIGIGNRWISAKKNLKTIQDLDYGQIDILLQNEVRNGKEYLKRGLEKVKAIES